MSRLGAPFRPLRRSQLERECGRLEGRLNEALKRESQLHNDLIAAERAHKRVAELEQAIKKHRVRFSGRTNQVCHDDVDLWATLMEADRDG